MPSCHTTLLSCLMSLALGSRLSALGSRPWRFRPTLHVRRPAPFARSHRCGRQRGVGAAAPASLACAAWGAIVTRIAAGASRPSLPRPAGVRASAVRPPLSSSMAMSDDQLGPYDLGPAVATAGGRCHAARRRADGRPVTVHRLDALTPAEARDVRARLAALGPADAAAVVAQLEMDGAPTVVTTPLPGGQPLIGWLAARAGAAAPAAPSPGSFTALFGAPPASRPTGELPPAASSPPPAAPASVAAPSRPKIGPVQQAAPTPA